jgi:putative membrane protein
VLPALARGAFSAHMTMHMMVVAVATPLIALGISGRRLDPVCRWPRLFAPVPLSMFEFFVVWAWHAPAWHHFARHTAHGVALEQGSFLLAGLLVWLAVFGGDRADGKRKGAGVLALLLTAMHMTLLGALLALTPRPLYAHADMSTTLTPLADQQLGGAIMIVGGGVAYIAGGLWLVAGLLRSKSAPIPRGAPGDGSPAPHSTEGPQPASLSRVSDAGRTS